MPQLSKACVLKASRDIVETRSGGHRIQATSDSTYSQITDLVGWLVERTGQGAG